MSVKNIDNGINLLFNGMSKICPFKKDKYCMRDLTMHECSPDKCNLTLSEIKRYAHLVNFKTVLDRWFGDSKDEQKTK